MGVVSDLHWTNEQSVHPYHCYNDIKDVFMCCCEPHNEVEMKDKPSIIYFKGSFNT